MSSISILIKSLQNPVLSDFFLHMDVPNQRFNFSFDPSNWPYLAFNFFCIFLEIILFIFGLLVVSLTRSIRRRKNRNVLLFLLRAARSLAGTWQREYARKKNGRFDARSTNQHPRNEKRKDSHDSWRFYCLFVFVFVSEEEDAEEEEASPSEASVRGRRRWSVCGAGAGAGGDAASNGSRHG